MCGLPACVWEGRLCGGGGEEGILRLCRAWGTQPGWLSDAAASALRALPKTGETSRSAVMHHIGKCVPHAGRFGPSRCGERDPPSLVVLREFSRGCRYRSLKDWAGLANRLFPTLRYGVTGCPLPERQRTGALQNASVLRSVSPCVDFHCRGGQRLCHVTEHKPCVP